jgi:hypothetical protein
MPTPRKYENAAARHAAYRQRQAQARRQDQREKGLPALPTIPTMPGDARWAKMIEKARRLLDDVVTEREAYFDDRSEAWCDSEKGDVFLERTDTVRDIADTLEALA